VKLSWRAAASKALSALSGGSRRGIGGPYHEKNYGKVEKGGFACNTIPHVCARVESRLPTAQPRCEQNL
jgi:hypothetical protein